uniref:Uncharacterized protein n=1 Tax=Anguilla anguilla TaxID=7936 RepID=A0A0E9WN08_ANGAN
MTYTNKALDIRIQCVDRQQIELLRYLATAVPGHSFLRNLNFSCGQFSPFHPFRKHFLNN